ncbi:MAG: hypothetical protein K2I96_25120 [Lachnospiraceae bacterium]|nr:hypothetical protein [Lachnospiraceae bacterium]
MADIRKTTNRFSGSRLLYLFIGVLAVIFVIRNIRSGRKPWKEQPVPGRHRHVTVYGGSGHGRTSGLGLVKPDMMHLYPILTGERRKEAE